MRAFLVRQFGSPATGAIAELPDPVPGPHDLLVDVHAAPVNFVDLLAIAGKYQFIPALPFIPGKGPAGVVAAVGDSVRGFTVGDRVLAMAEYGGYAEKVMAPEIQCYRLPEGMPFADAAAMSLAFDTAWFALKERARYASGESVLVLGASGAVGYAAIQLAKALGARVLGAVSSPGKAELVTAAGADAIIDLSRPNLRDSLREQVYAEMQGRGVDIVLDPIGGDGFAAAIRALAWCGRLVVIGFAAGDIPTLKVNYLLLKNIEVSGLQISDYRRKAPLRVAECFAEIFALYAAGKLRAPPVTRFPLEDCARALERVQNRASSRVILERGV
ncbi:MAG: NADPH:quinone oxidoreductase family protein [Stellaceae bacterium]